MKIVVRTVALLAVLTLTGASVYEVALRERRPHRSLPTTPSTYLWAWERPEDLEFIDTAQHGVAFLAKTISIRGTQLSALPRRQPLKVKDGTKLVAVVRLEVARGETPEPSQAEAVAAEISEVSSLRNLTAIQIDFDATTSQRQFYRDILELVRSRLPEKMPLSITALASWCSGDNWLKGLPIDEAVPMFFRMGVDKKQFESRLQSGSKFVGEPCQGAAGVSTDEPVVLPEVDRLYIFSPTAWTQSSLNQAMEAYKR